MKTNLLPTILALAGANFVLAVPAALPQEAVRADTSGTLLTPLNLDSGQIVGRLSPDHLGLGAPTSATVLRGDGTWASTTPSGATIASTSNLLMGDGAGNALAVAGGGANLLRVFQVRLQSALAAMTTPTNLLPPSGLQGTVPNANGTITIPANGSIHWSFVAGDGTGTTALYGYAVAVSDAPVGALVIRGNYGADIAASDSSPLPGVYRSTFVVPGYCANYTVYVRNTTASPVTIYYPVLATADSGLSLLSSYADSTPVAAGPVADLDFTRFESADRSARYQLEARTTVAADSVNGNDANAGTLYAPRQTLAQTAISAAGAVVGLYRGSLFRESLPLPTSTTHGLAVQDAALGSVKPLPVISGLDPVASNTFVGNGDGTYSYDWVPADTAVTNDGYSNVYVVEINTATEAATPIAARRRMTDLASQAAVAAAPGSAYIQPAGGGWTVALHPSDGLTPGTGSFRYEVVARAQPANWGSFDTNAGDGAMSGLVLVGGSSGYGALSAPRAFAGDRLVFVHATTHNAVIGGGSLARSVFYESGDLANGSGPSIQLAWYAGTATGLAWNTSRCLFYMNVGDRFANGLISHSGNGSNFDRGDIADCAFLGARWSDGSLHGTAIDYANVATGTLNRVYVQGVTDAFGVSMPAGLETKNSVFRQVNHAFVSGSFHDNIVEAEDGADPNDVNHRLPLGCKFQNNGATLRNNLIWSHGVANAVAGEVGAVLLATQSGVVGSATHNILVCDPQTPATQGYYFQGPLTAGTALDYNLVIFTGKFYGGGTQNNFSWADYLANNPTLDQHSLFVDLSADPRGLAAVFANPNNGDFRWAQTHVASQCAAFCAANLVGPATVTTHWPSVPSVDQAVAAITLLPPTITSPGAVSFTDGVPGNYQITTNLDGTPGAPTGYSAAGLPAWLGLPDSSGTMSGTPLQTGNFGVTISATNLAGTGSAVLGITAQTAFTAWRNAYFTVAELNDPTVSGPEATPARDGIPNLLKYALGLNPKINGSGSLPTVSFTAAGGASFLTLTYNRSLAASDVTCTVEVSGDLQTWSSGPGYTATVATTSNAANTMQTVIQRDLTPTSSARRRFVRLKVTQP